MHEVTSPQAFDGLRLAGRKVRRPDLTVAIEDHNVPTDSLQVHDPVGRLQLEALRANCAENGIELYQIGHERQGIVHVVAPQLGLIQPGMTAVCGDSHTSTLGPSARSRSVSAPATSSMCWPPRRWCCPVRAPCWPTSPASCPRGRRQGPDPCADRPDRDRRCAGPRHRVRRRGAPRPVHGGPDDDVQHEHRSRRAGGPVRPRRGDLRLSARSAARSPGSRLGAGTGVLAEPADRPRRRLRPHRPDRRLHPCPQVTWGTNPRRPCRWTTWCRLRTPSRTTARGPPPTGRWSTWG